MDIEQKGIEFEILGKRLNEIYIKTIEQAQRAQSKFRFATNGAKTNVVLITIMLFSIKRMIVDKLD